MSMKEGFLNSKWDSKGNFDKVEKPPLAVKGDKPKKEELVNDLYDWFATNCLLLEFSGLSRKKVLEYIREPYTYNNIVKLYKFLTDDEFVWVLNDLKRFLSYRTPEQWHMIHMMNPQDTIIVDLRKRMRNVVMVWQKRPRFEVEKGMLSERNELY
jgi:hypothetical protein